MGKLRNSVMLSMLAVAVGFNCNQVFAADQISSTEKMTDLTASSSLEQPKTEVQPLNNLKSNNAEIEKNIVPVFDLKGGVKEIEVPQEDSKIKAWLNGDYATGDWKGFRSNLEDHGVTVSGSYINNDFMKLHGGISKKNKPLYQGIVTTGVALDTEKMKLWHGGKLYASFMNNHGNSGISRNYVGDYMLVNTYEGSNFSRLYELWYEQSMLKDKLKVRVGKQDTNLDFCALDSAEQFSNGGFFIQNTSVVTFPKTAAGVTAQIKPVDWLTLKSGWMDGATTGEGFGTKSLFDHKDGFLNIEELDITHNINNHKGKYMVGGIINTTNAEEITSAPDPRTFSNSYNIYTGFDQVIFKEQKDSEDSQGLSVFGQFGWAPSDRRDVSRYYGVGAVYTGLIPHRDSDVTGIASNFSLMSDRYKTIDGRGDEAVIEVFHKVQLTPWLAIQPDLQYVNNPSGTSKSAYVLGLKTLITF